MKIKMDYNLSDKDNAMIVRLVFTRRNLYDLLPNDSLRYLEKWYLGKETSISKKIEGLRLMAEIIEKGEDKCPTT